MKIFLPKNFEPQKPIKIYDHEDMMISLFSSQINPHQFSIDKLKEMDIIPFDWQLSKPVLSKPSSLQFYFKSGIIIIINTGNISFVGKINKNAVDLGEIINKFVAKFSQYNWQRIQINVRRLISLPGDKENGAKFINETLLHSKKWDISGIKPMKAQVAFRYSFLENPLMINITDVQIQNRAKDKKVKSGLLFQGIFNYNLTKKFNTKMTYIHSIINNYDHNLQIFNRIIEENFLSE